MSSRRKKEKIQRFDKSIFLILPSTEGYFRVTKRVEDNVKIGYINKNGEILIPFRFNYAFDFVKNYAVVIENQHFGVIDKKGNYVIEPKWHFLSSYKNKSFLAKTKENSKFLVLNEKGKEIFSFNASYAQVIENKKNKGGILFQKEYFGLYDMNGELIINPSKSKYEILYTGNSNHFIAKKNGKYGVINFKNEVIVPFKFEDAVETKGDYFGLSKNNQWYIFDKNGDMVSKETFAEVGEYSNNLIIVKNEKNKYGFLNTSGYLSIPFEYDYVKPFSVFQVAPVFKNGKFYLINKFNIPICQRQDVVSVNYTTNSNLIIVRDKFNLCGVIDETGFLKIPFYYKNISKFYDDAAVVHDVDGFDIINSENVSYLSKIKKVKYLD